MENNLVASTTPVYTLSTTSTLSGIPVHSIRQYIDKGLIIPFKKESSRNLFSQVDILRLNFIHKLLDEGGLNIAGIRMLLALIPCWAITECSLAERETCQAYHSDSYPCWKNRSNWAPDSGVKWAHQQVMGKLILLLNV